MSKFIERKGYASTLRFYVIRFPQSVMSGLFELSPPYVNLAQVTEYSERVSEEIMRECIRAMHEVALPACLPSQQILCCQTVK